MGKLTMYYIFSLVLFIQLIYGQAVTRHEAAHSFDVVGILNGFFSDIQVAHQLKEKGNLVENLPDLDELYGLGKQLFDTELMSSVISAPNNQCIHDIMYITEDLLNSKNPWRLYTLDSFGKMESGILEGNFKWIGDFNECRNVYAPLKANASVGDFHGQYCLLTSQLKLMNKPLPVSVGVCLPDTCDATTLKNDIIQVLNVTALGPFIDKLQGFLNTTTLDCHADSKPLTSGAIFMIVFLSFFILLAIIGSSITTYEYFFEDPEVDAGDPLSESHLDSKGFLVNENTEAEFHRDTTSEDDVLILILKTSHLCKGIKEFCQCFCIFTNGQKLLDTSSTKGQLLSIHGIRFLSMTWVIVCHVYMFCFSIVSNPVAAEKTLDNWPFQIIIQGFYSVDSFFVLSGFLMAYLFFQESEKRDGKVAWLPFYIHRYIRLTPVYMIMLGFATALFPFLGSGPYWPQYDTDPICKDYWWWNILYINNFAPAEKQCVGWSWYLANDMQFFAISPLFLITLRRWPKIGFSLLGLFLCGTCAANFGITYYYHLVPGINVVIGDTHSVEEFTQMFADFFNFIYIKPYTRIGPYLIGLALGYYLFKRKQNQKGKDSRVTLTIGWIIATTVTLACVYGLYHRKQSVLEISFYNAFNRSCYAAGLAWVMYVCLTGQGGPVNGILSYKFFMPLGRLTYSAYLIHPLVLTGYFTTRTAPLVFTHITIVTMFLGLLVITYALSLVVSLLFESPIIKLEKIVRNKFKS